MDANTVTTISTGLTEFGQTLITNFASLIPALAGLAAILFVISIVKNKIGA